MWTQGWLDYKKIEGMKERYTHIVAVIDGVCIDNALAELRKALGCFQGIDVQIATNKIIPSQVKEYIILKETTNKIGNPEGFRWYEEEGNLYIEADTDQGILYGSFDLIRQLACGQSLKGKKKISISANSLRMLNHWDNMDGSIERGYAGGSFFFKDNQILLSDRLRDYARLNASVGINGIVINNVNVKGEACALITERHLPLLKRMSEVLESYGIRLYLSLNFAAPIEEESIGTADPLDPQVIQWWSQRMALIFGQIPKLGGFLVKADSEGRPGPFTYGRSQAQGANMLAKAMKEFGGLLIWRCFVYNCQQDWRDRKTDRAKAGYESFVPLDGKFEDNVLLQIKNGPMDFQVREPVSPLFGAMKMTNQMLEVQIAQEYTGQQRHVCYLLPMWKEILDFETGCKNENDRVKEVISGKTYQRPIGGIAGVANTGDDMNWCGHDLAGANWYGYGRLSWDPNLDSEDVAREWVAQAISGNKAVIDKVTQMLMMSWPAYENYTTPLGIGWMVNPGYHYGPNPDGYEYSRWGTYHRTDHTGIGIDRTGTGTAYTDQYFAKNKRIYENVESCPEKLLLFFHRIPFDYHLKNGQTLLQHMYDLHFEGLEEVEAMIGLWESLENSIDEGIYNRTKERLIGQYEDAKEWRDVINSYFYRKSGIDDEKKRTIY